MKLREHFVAGTTARTAVRLVGVNKTTAAYYYHRLRQVGIPIFSINATPIPEPCGMLLVLMGGGKHADWFQTSALILSSGNNFSTIYVGIRFGFSSRLERVKISFQRNKKRRATCVARRVNFSSSRIQVQP